MIRGLALAVAMAAGVLSVVSPALGAATATVRVDGNAFGPVEAVVDKHGAVTWLVQEGGHTIVADDGRFAFRGDGGTTLPAGSTVSFEFSGDEFVAYHCDVHGGRGGQGMAGRIRVGNPPGPPAHHQPVIRVPEDAPTLAAAVAVAAPGHRIELGVGDHVVTEPVNVDAHDLTIVGRDPTSRLVPAAGRGGFPSTALRVTGARSHVERLRIAGFRDSGVYLDGSDGSRLVDVHIDGAGFTQDGIVATAVRGVTLRGTTTSGNRGAGIRVGSCPSCGVLIDGVRSSDNSIGVLVEAAVGVTLRRSLLERNGVGVVARAIRSAYPLRPVTVTVVDNVIGSDTDSRTGVRVSGASDTVVSRNTVSGALAWDGVGRTVTFADNRDFSGARKEPTVDPTVALL